MTFDPRDSATSRHSTEQEALEPVPPVKHCPREETREHIERHLPAIKELITDLYSSKRGDPVGAEAPAIELEGGVSATRIFRAGKQQPVAGYELRFPDGFVTEIVLRPVASPSPFAENYGSSSTIRESYPTMFHREDIGRNQEVLVVEMLRGHHEWSSPEKFRLSLEREGALDSLLDSMYRAADSLLAEGFGITDVKATQGHNVMFLPESERYQLFDVDTLKASNDSHAFKFQRFLGQVSATNETDLEFGMRMIERYDREHPGELAEAYSAKDRPAYVPIKDQSKLKGIPEGYELIPKGHPDHSKGHAECWMRGFDDAGPNTVYLKRFDREVFKIDQEVLEASRAGDMERLRARLIATRGEIGTVHTEPLPRKG